MPKAGDPYTLSWTAPGRSSADSMPLGNGDIGVNLWVEQGGDLRFYVSKTDAYDEFNRLLKVGRVRIGLQPNPFGAGLPFRQTLRTRTGEIEIEAGLAAAVVCRIWVDANYPVVRVEVESREPISVTVTAEIWRTDVRPLIGLEAHSAYGLHDGPGLPEAPAACSGNEAEIPGAARINSRPTGPGRLMCFPDTLLAGDNGALVFYHRNVESCWAGVLHHQGLGSLAGQLEDPLLHRTFGARVEGDGFERVAGSPERVPAPDFGPLPLTTSGKQRDATNLSLHCSATTFALLTVTVLTAQTETADDFIAELSRLSRSIGAVPWETAKRDHRSWWAQFWDRSKLEVSGPDETDAVQRAYALQRFVNAAGGRGQMPIKFNGSIFTADWGDINHPVLGKTGNYDADYRAWGGCFWFQNTRLPYWSMLASGDFDQMEPLFRMYREMLPLATGRTRLYFGHDGGYLPETVTFWGAYANSDYGLDRAGQPPSWVANPYIHYHWNGMLELLALALALWEYAVGESSAFAEVARPSRPPLESRSGSPPVQKRELLPTETLLSFADAFIAFFDRHFPRDADGKLHLYPSQPLEAWPEAVDSAPDLAGLQRCLEELIRLPVELVGEARRSQWRRLREELRELPAEEGSEVRGQGSGVRRSAEGLCSAVLLPAREVIGQRLSSENPELYAIWPYRLYGIARDNAHEALATWEQRANKGTGGWRQDAIQAACLGLADEARALVVKNCSPEFSPVRFPGFWGPNFDWIPDQCHGAITMIALQQMLLQVDGPRIVLFPAWPKDWDVSFKLHAPFDTVVEGEYRGGVLRELRVTPAEREKDVAPRAVARF
jgi:Domain of unknown function (DUF5703)